MRQAELSFAVKFSLRESEVVRCTVKLLRSEVCRRSGKSEDAISE